MKILLKNRAVFSRTLRLCCARMSDSTTGNPPDSQVQGRCMSSSADGNTSSNNRHVIAVCQMTAMADKGQNLKTVKELIARGSSRGAKMIFLPEACDYIGETRQQTLEQAETLQGDFVRQCQAAAVEHGVWLSVGGFHQKNPSSSSEESTKILNTHVVISAAGKVEATYHKAHMFDLDIPGKVRLCESDFTTPGDKMAAPVCTPVGRVGLAVCYDLRFPEMSLSLTKQGAQLLTFPSAFTQTTGMAHWESLLRTRAIETQCYVVAAAQTGRHNEKRSSYGHSMIVDPWGAVIAECSEGTGVCVAEVDLTYLDKVRRDMPVWQHRRHDLYGEVKVTGDGSRVAAHPDSQPSYTFGHVSLKSEQVFYRSQLSIAFVNIKPVLAGHTLVAPLRPAVHLSDLTPAEVADLFTSVQEVSEVVKRHFGATSVTVAVQDGPEAGQTVKHVHVHILPRKKHDFADNDDVYDEIQNHDKGWDAETRLRSEAEMAAEARELRGYFYPGNT